MAESQGNYAYDATVLAALDRSLSAERLRPYLASALGDRTLALKRYLWNARLAKAFLYPVHIAEITTRNSMHRAISNAYAPDWLLTSALSLTPESQKSLDTALKRLSKKPGPIKPDDVVAALTFDFWSNLFRVEYDPLWMTPGLLRRVFPDLPVHFGRHDVQTQVATINHLRNRIAHHEPIHSPEAPLLSAHEAILELIGWQCASTKSWVTRHSTLPAEARSPPTTSSTLPGHPLASTNIRPPLLLERTSVLADAIHLTGNARPAVALVPDPTHTPPWRALFAKDLLAFISDAAAKQGSMIDLGDYTVADVLATTAPVAVSEIDRSATTGDAAALFFPSKTREALRPRLLIVRDKTKPGAPVVGVIAHPEVMRPVRGSWFGPDFGHSGRVCGILIRGLVL